MSEFNFQTTHAYSTDGMVDGMMKKEDFIACFKQLNTASSIESQLTTSREDFTLWKELQLAFNTIARKMTVANRSYQV